MKRPRFSLRTLMIGIAVLSIPIGWSAYQLNWIRQRREFLTRPGVDWYIPSISEWRYIPWHLKLFGEQSAGPLGSLCEPRYLDVPPELVDEGRKLFPELVVT